MKEADHFWVRGQFLLYSLLAAGRSFIEDVLFDYM
jgi:hypothetical protein